MGLSSLLCCTSAMAFERDPDVVLSLDPSATTFLNGQLLDRAGNVVYAIETANSQTSISAPAQQRRGGQTRSVAGIKWPIRYVSKQKSSRKSTAAGSEVLVTVNGETTTSGRLLRRRKLPTDGKSHKFRIDGYRPTFRWKKRNGKYLLFATGLRQPLANLYCDVFTATFRLEITGAYISSYHSQDRPGAISSILLDHIVITALLLVTPPLEWRRIAGATATRTSISEEDDLEEPEAFVFSDAFLDDDCHAHPDMREALRRAELVAREREREREQRREFEGPLQPMEIHISGLRRSGSLASSASSRTLVQNIVGTILQTISSSGSQTWSDTESYLDSSATGTSYVPPPPPYERGQASHPAA